MLRRFHRFQKNEDGQAIILAVIGMLLLSLAVLTTVNIGTAVHDRIALQNGTDAQAYSIAVQEARTFNYYAFANRAQASHYVSAMIAQSWLSFFNFLMAAAADIIAFLKTITLQCPGGFICGITCKPLVKLIKKAIAAIPVLGQAIAIAIQILEAITAAIEGIYTMLTTLYDQVDDFVSTLVIPAAAIANYFTFVTQFVLFGGTMSHIFSLDKKVRLENDKNSDSNAIVDAALSLINTGGDVLGVHVSGFYNAHDPNSVNPGKLAKWRPLTGNPDDAELDGSDGSSPGNTQTLAEAKRVMTGIANSSRFPGFVTDRNVWDWIDKLVGNLGNPFDKIVSLMGKLNNLKQFFEFQKYGQTRMGTKPQPYYIRDPSPSEQGQYPRGNSMTSDDPYYFVLAEPLLIPCENIGIPFIATLGQYCYAGTKGIVAMDTYDIKNSQIRGGPGMALQGANWQTGADSDIHQRWVSIWAVNFDGGVHCGIGNNSKCRNRLCTSTSEGAAVDNAGWCLPLWKAHHSCWRENSNFVPGKKRHFWFAVTPFMKYNPNHKPGTDFAEPSVWTVAYHTAQKGENKVAVLKDGEIGINNRGTVSSMHLTNKAEALFGSGMYQAISRAKVYYHRPGVWAEHENFFNPYWGARLEPIAPGFTNVVMQIPLINNLVSRFSSGGTLTNVLSNWVVMH